jgi:hypothetical protein
MRLQMDCPVGQHGPLYPRLPGVERHRRAAKKGLKHLSLEERHRYGEAVERAILALQRQECRRGISESSRSNCASGTAYNTGAAIHEAIRQQQRNALLNCAAKIRRDRSDDEWREMYKAAMKEKRERVAPEQDNDPPFGLMLTAA